jgi:hypothetical protein
MACRSRSKLAMKSSETVLCDGMLMASFGQFATYGALSCVSGKALPTKIAGGRFTTEHKREA